MSDFNECDFAPTDRWDEQDSDPIADLYYACLLTTPSGAYEARKYWGMKILRHRNEKTEGLK